MALSAPLVSPSGLVCDELDGMEYSQLRDIALDHALTYGDNGYQGYKTPRYGTDEYRQILNAIGYDFLLQLTTLSMLSPIKI